MANLEKLTRKAKEHLELGEEIIIGIIWDYYCELLME